MKAAISTVLVAALALGCSREEPSTKPDPASRANQRLPVETVAAPVSGDVQEIVRREVSLAKQQGRTLLVYVGAAWCEPCKRFHDAASRGELDSAFPGLRLIEFDLDRDGDRLKQAGYSSKMIPLFAAPLADGRSSGRQIEGSIKGPGAVDQISPRLKALLSAL